MSTTTTTKKKPTTTARGRTVTAKAAARSPKRVASPSKQKVAETRKAMKAYLDAGGVKPMWPAIQPVTVPKIVPLRRPANNWADGSPGRKVVLVGGDLHIGFRWRDGKLEPLHSITALDVFIQVAEQQQPDAIVLNGDVIGFDEVSNFAQGASFQQTTQPTLQWTANFLGQLRVAAPNAEIYFSLGNHCARWLRFIEENMLAAAGLRRVDLPGDEWPEEWPVLSLQSLLRLDEMGVQLTDAYPAATHWLNDRTRVTHGTKSNSRGSTTAAYLAESPHLSTIVGHSHRQELTWASLVAAGGKRIQNFSLNPGVLCRVDGAVPSTNSATDAKGNSATVTEDWQQGFALVAIEKDYAWPTVYPIIDGRTVMPGKEWTVIEATPGLNDSKFYTWPYQLADAA